MDQLSCQVFPDPNEDVLGGLEGDERIAALRSLFRKIEEFLMSERGLSAKPRPTLMTGRTELASYLEVDPAVAEERTGLRGLREVNLLRAANGVAFKAPSLVDLYGEPPVFPVLLVEFYVEAEWEPGSAELPFFKELAEVMGTKRLVLGYNCPFPSAASIQET